MLYGIGHLLDLLPGLVNKETKYALTREDIRVCSSVSVENLTRLTINTIADTVQVNLFGSQLIIQSVPYNCGAVHFPAIIRVVIMERNWDAFGRVEEILGQYGGYSSAIISLAHYELNDKGNLLLDSKHQKFVERFNYKPIGSPILNKRSDNFIQWYQKKLNNDEYYLDDDDRRYNESEMSDSISSREHDALLEFTH